MGAVLQSVDIIVSFGYVLLSTTDREELRPHLRRQIRLPPHRRPWGQQPHHRRFGTPSLIQLRNYQAAKARGQVTSSQPAQFNPNRYVSYCVNEHVATDRVIDHESFSRVQRRWANNDSCLPLNLFYFLLSSLLCF